MPNPIYNVGVSLDGIATVTPALSAFEFGTRPAVFMSAYDNTNVWALEARLAYHAYSSGPTLYEYRAEFYAYFLVPFNGDPGTGSFVAGTFSIVQADGSNGAAITSGFTMSIEKDYDADALRFITPLGTITKTLTSFGALDLSKLRMDGMAHQMVRPNGGGTGSDNWDWYNYFGKQDGVNFQGAALSTADPGSWSGISDVTFGFPVAPIVNSSNVQNATRFSTAMSYVAANAPRASGNRQWRTWTGGDSLLAAAGMVVDMTLAREHGAHWAAYAYSASLSTLNYRRTFDKGEHWSEGIIHAAGGSTHRSVSINWYYGLLFAVWDTTTQIVQSVSSDLGNTWGTPVALSITGTQPRHLVHPTHGLSFYFYVSGSDLQLVRSGDFGATFIDAAPIAVVSGVGSQTVAAQFGPDDSLIVGFISAGAWSQVRSTDLGRTWS